MTRARIPTNVLELKGAFKKDPQRLKERENEPQNVNDVGDPPDSLTDDEQAAFSEIVRLAIPGVLGEADRLAIEAAAKLLIQCRAREASAQEQTQFFRYLGQFGMLPADRAKISIPKEKPRNSFDAKNV